MNIKPGNWLPPEEALTRFQSGASSFLELDIAVHHEAPYRYGFKVDNMGFLIENGVICEVVKDFRLYPIPNTCKWMRGWVNLRGNLIPAYDFSLLLGVTDEIEDYKNLLILGKGRNAVGVLIDDLPKSCNIETWDKLNSAPQLPTGLTNFVNDAYSDQQDVWFGFDYKNYFISLKDDIAI